MDGWMDDLLLSTGLGAPTMLLQHNGMSLVTKSI